MFAPAVATAIPNSGKFADVCVGSFADELLTIVNNGPNLLSISNITSSSSDFSPPGVLSYPLNVSADGSLDLVIRFQPTTSGTKSATITILSNDPAGPHKITVSGFCRVPKLNLAIADAGNFGKVCVGSFVDEPLILNNSGFCRVLVTAISFSSGEFLVPHVISFPLAIGPGNSLALPVRFQPTSLGAKAATLTVTSDDPASPESIHVSGHVPAGKLAVTGSTNFGGVTACCCADRTISICNVGECRLLVTGVRFKRKSHHWRLIQNPFPAVLHPGSCLSLVIQYRATERCSRSCELIIESDDPSTPVKIIEVLACTVWDTCGCKDCCEECRKGRCEKHHKDPCRQQGYPCCSDDDEDQEDE
jgi:hypothetical protein